MLHKIIYCLLLVRLSNICSRGHHTESGIKFPGPPFTKRTDVLPQDLVKSQSRKIGCNSGRIVLKFERHLGSAAAEVPIKIQSDWTGVKPNLAASRLCGKTSYSVVNRSPGSIGLVGFFGTAFSILSLLTWRCKRQGHQQAWYFIRLPGIFHYFDEMSWDTCQYILYSREYPFTIKKSV